MKRKFKDGEYNFHLKAIKKKAFLRGYHKPCSWGVIIVLLITGYFLGTVVSRIIK